MSENVLDRLSEAIRNGDDKATAEIAGQLVEDPARLSEAVDVAIATIRKIGDLFGAGELFLPEMVLAADAMLAFMEVAGPHLEQSDLRAHAGTKIVLGTVKGDIHSIGKDIVATMLKASGFEVIDMGVSVSPMDMIKTAGTSGAKVIGLSALMTTSMPYQREAIDLLNSLDKRDQYWVVVGGGPVTSEYAQSIGADGWAANAAGAARLCTQLVESQSKPSTMGFVAEED